MYTDMPRPVPEPFVRATRALDAAGIAWCRLRSLHGGSEDDVLVEPVSNGRLDAVLAQAGFAPDRRPGRGAHRAYHAYDEAGGTWWKLDTVTRIELGPHQEVPTNLAPGFLQRRLNRGLATEAAGAPVTDGATLAPDDAFWALLLHELWDRPKPVIRRGAELAALAARARSTLTGATAVEPLLPKGVTPADVIAWAHAGDERRLLDLGARLRSRSGFRATRRRLGRRLVRWLDRRDPPFVRRGLTIALLGPDGTGKSTLTATIGRGGPVRTKAVYLGLYGGRRGGAGRARVPGLGFAGRLLRMWRGWLVGAWHARRGRLVIFDRHPFDARLPSPGSRRALGRKLLARALPAPDLAIVLDAPPEVLYARKPELPVERLAEQRAGYLELARRLERAAVVDVTAPADAVARRVTRLAWDRIVERSAGR